MTKTLKNIDHPVQPTYFIAWQDTSPIGYDVTNSDQITTSGADNFETYTNHGQWTARLIELGVNPNN